MCRVRGYQFPSVTNTPCRHSFDTLTRSSRGLYSSLYQYIHQVELKKAKMLEILLASVFSMVYDVQKLREFFFLEKKYFRLVELGPKFGIWAFSAIFALFFRVPKNLIYFNNAFNGYRYLKSTRKELSDGTLMLKKEYCLDRWNCD